MSTAINVLTLASFLILINERITEFIYKPLIRDLTKLAGRPALAKKILPYFSAISAAVIVVGFNVDILRAWAAAMGFDPMPPAWVTMALTALIVSGGSNLLHDIWARITGGAPAPKVAPPKAAAPAVDPTEAAALPIEAAPPLGDVYPILTGATPHTAQPSSREVDAWLMGIGLDLARHLGNGNPENGLKRMVIRLYRQSDKGG